MWRAALLLLLLTALPGLAQEGRLTPVDVLEPPRSAEARALAAKAEAAGIATRMVYARVATGAAKPAPSLEPSPQPVFIPRFGSGSVWVVVLLLIAAIALWLRFGAGGVLMAPTSKDAPKPATAPDHWLIPDSDLIRSPASLLEQIATMSDRRAALIRLLRHCLLRAGVDNQTRFARSDTEREAFARLPRTWSRQEPLAVILQSAELAHYGGRPVADDDFTAALDAGRAILGGGRRV